MNSVDFFVYSWKDDDERMDNNGDSCTVIRMFGITKDNHNVAVKISDFHPYCYVEIPDGWNNTKISTLKEEIRRIGYVVDVEIKHMKRLYYSKKEKKDGRYVDVLIPHLRVYCKSRKNLWYLKSKLSTHTSSNVKGFLVQECDASSMLKFQSVNKLPSCGWITATGIYNNREKSSFDISLDCSYKKVLPSNKASQVNPLVLSFDIEVHSSDLFSFPEAGNPGDCVFQIGISVWRQGDPLTKVDKYLITLKQCDHIPNVKVIEVKTESELICMFSNIVNEINPNVIIGYNILGFDFRYMIERSGSAWLLCKEKLASFGCYPDRTAQERVIDWSSKAYSDQKFLYLDADGRLIIDLFPFIQREYKLNSYKLDSVAKTFLKGGESKIDLKPKDIFTLFDRGESSAIARIGDYCVQDTVVPLHLFDKLNVWVTLSESAKTNQVPIFYLYTKGQQIKTYSQLYNHCYGNTVVESNAFVASDDESYKGALVLDPIPGIYDNIIPFDFASLYPSLIIAYNYDFTTFVTDDNIPDEDCTVDEWVEHSNCEHDDMKSKTKKHVVCGVRFKYRFLKREVAGYGVVPVIIQKLIQSRKEVRQMIEANESKIKQLDAVKDATTIDTLRFDNVILDKRQLSYKVSANSMYGATGVKKGFIPFMPMAMCITYKGRESLLRAKRELENRGVTIVYGDTDSCYAKIPDCNDAKELWDKAKAISTSISSCFPLPMKLEFDRKIFSRLFMLSKKRYMAITSDKNGNRTNDIFSKGVTTVRKDGCALLKDIYTRVSRDILFNVPRDEILYSIVEYINDMFCLKIPQVKYVMSGKVSSGYKKPPAHAVLAERMKEYGVLYEPGSRIEYIMTTEGGKKANVTEKIREYDYFKTYAEYLRIDYIAYISRQVQTFLDEMLLVAYKINGFVKQQCELRECKIKYLEEIKQRAVKIAITFEKKPTKRKKKEKIDHQPILF